MGKQHWPRPAAWAVAQNEALWQEFDSVIDRSVIVTWSLGDNYRTKMMQPGDRSVFWVTGVNGGIARVGFVLSVKRTPHGFWRDATGKKHSAPFSGKFFMPPFPNRRYIHRAALAGKATMSKCELLTSASQMQAPLRIEPNEWALIERLLVRFDATNAHFRGAWKG